MPKPEPDESEWDDRPRPKPSGPSPKPSFTERGLHIVVIYFLVILGLPIVAAWLFILYAMSHMAF